MADIAARVEFSHSQSIVDIIWSSPLRITSFSRLEDSTTIVPILSGMCPCGSELYPPACEKNAQRASAAAAAISGAVAAANNKAQFMDRPGFAALGIIFAILF